MLVLPYENDGRIKKLKARKNINKEKKIKENERCMYNSVIRKYKWKGKEIYMLNIKLIDLFICAGG